MANETVKHLTGADFESFLTEKKVALVDFWASWCGPCRMVSPIVDEVAEEVEGRVKVAKVNVDEQPELAQRFQVMSIPTLVVMKKGKVVSTSVGVKSKNAILNMVSD